MSSLLEDVRLLAEKIGPRGTGTPAEAAAAEVVLKRLSSLGLPAELHSFPAVPSQNVFPMAINLVALSAFVLYPWNSAFTRWLAAILGMSTAPMLWQTIRNARNLMRPLLPKVTSRNVETRLQPQGDLRQRVVLLAHLDTNRCRLAWQSKTVSAIEPLTWLTLAMLAFLGLLYFAGALLGGPLWPWWLSLLPAAYVLGTLVTLWKDDRTPYSPGAHDNAASVAVALEVAARLSRQPLQSTEVWFVFDGAEETDHSGVRDLLRRHGAPLRQASFIVLEGLGSGEIVYLTRQGVCSHYRPDPELQEIAEHIASDQPELGFRQAQMVMEDDTRTLRQRGLRAICICGRDPETGVLPRWHRHDDTAATVSESTMKQAADIVHTLLEELDRGAEAQITNENP